MNPSRLLHNSLRRLTLPVALIAGALSLPLAAFGQARPATAAPAAATGPKYAPPASARMTYNFNPDWKFIKEEVPYSETPTFDDSKWQTVSTPHTYNDTDSFDELIRTSGEVSLYMGAATYRKHFKLPASAANGKVFLEFEGMRQAAYFYVNGKFAGKYENGVTACGIDITSLVNFGDQANVLNVKITNANNYTEEATGTGYQWGSKDFNPNYGGLNQNVWLHVTGKVYQTLPIYENLETSGVYIYPSNFSIPNKTCDVNVESQIRNESDARQNVSLSVAIVDRDGIARATFTGESRALEKGETAILKAKGPLANAQFWSPETPNLYSVYSIVSVDGKVVDTNKISTGFRKAEYRGGAGTGGVFINDKFVYLKGYAIRSTNEWAAVGGAYPDWMRDFTMDMIRVGYGNYIRWMHIAPKPADSRAADRFGIVQIAPGGDKEANPPNIAQWNQRMQVMRDTIIYFRNSPSVLFWEAGNNGIPADRMQAMVDLRKQWDPNGGRVMGCRTLNDPETTKISEFFGVMIGQDRQTDALQTPQAMFRAYSDERRDIAPFIETEDYRDEGARRFWDNYSPPHFGFKPGPQDVQTYVRTSQEHFVMGAAGRYYAYEAQRIDNPDPKRSKWAGYASIIFADSNQHGRMGSSEVARVSGKVDAVRLPKEGYFLHRVMQNDNPDVRVIGHWTYPDDTVKPVLVAGNHVDSIELFVNNKSVGVQTQPTNGYIYTFPGVKYEFGTIKAIAKKGGQIVAQDEILSAGQPSVIRLTPHTGPTGLLADGSDVAFFDVEVVDAEERRYSTDEARIDFEITGPAVWRGGYNSGVLDSINKPYLLTENGINRVFIRSTLEPGTITLKATRPGLQPAVIQIESKRVPITNGLTTVMPPQLPAPPEAPTPNLIPVNLSR